MSLSLNNIPLSVFAAMLKYQSVDGPRATAELMPDGHIHFGPLLCGNFSAVDAMLFDRTGFKRKGPDFLVLALKE